MPPKTGSRPCSNLAWYSTNLMHMKMTAPSSVNAQYISSLPFWLTCADRTPMAMVHELSSSTTVLTAPSRQLSCSPPTLNVSG